MDAPVNHDSIGLGSSKESGSSSPIQHLSKGLWKNGGGWLFSNLCIL